MGSLVLKVWEAHGIPWIFVMILSCLIRYMMSRGYPGFHYTIKVAKMNSVIWKTFNEVTSNILRALFKD